MMWMYASVVGLRGRDITPCHPEPQRRISPRETPWWPERRDPSLRLRMTGDTPSAWITFGPDHDSSIL